MKCLFCDAFTFQWPGRAASFESQASCPSPKPPQTPWWSQLECQHHLCKKPDVCFSDKLCCLSRSWEDWIHYDVSMFVLKLYLFIWMQVLQVLYRDGYAQHSSTGCFSYTCFGNVSETFTQTTWMVGPRCRRSWWFSCLFSIGATSSSPQALSCVTVLVWNGTKFKGYAAQYHKNIYLMMKQVSHALTLWLENAGNWAFTVQGLRNLSKSISHSCRRCVTLNSHQSAGKAVADSCSICRRIIKLKCVSKNSTLIVFFLINLAIMKWQFMFIFVHTEQF